MSTGGNKQIPEPSYTLMKKFYFFPGITRNMAHIQKPQQQLRQSLSYEIQRNKQQLDVGKFYQE